jgi:hypothetical protein
MATPTLELISALRVTVQRLRSGERYQWTHQGCCNCGHLAQTITRQDRATIHQLALEKAGDWGEKAVEYCPTSGYPIDHIIGQMLAIGLTREDIYHLERVSDRRVLLRLPEGQRDLQRNRREDVILYMETWAALLEEALGLDPRGDDPRGLRALSPRPAPEPEDPAPLADADAAVA